MHMQFLDTAVVVCKSERQGSKKAEGRWGSASLGVKTLRVIRLRNR
jgi:hypothetical protein